MSRRINIYPIILIAIFLSALLVKAVFLFKSHFWFLDVCQKLLTNYWVYAVPLVSIGASFFSVWQIRKSKKKIASFKYTDAPVLPDVAAYFKKGKTKVFESQTPLAFTFGFLRPRIYLSTALIETLNESELRAILAHENVHLAKKHHFWSIVLSFVKYTLFFLPIVYWLYSRHRAKIELDCDREAARVVGDSLVVAGALLKLKRFSFNSGTAAVMGISAGNLEERVKVLLGEKSKSCWKKPLLLSLFSLLIFLAITSLAMAQQVTNCCFRT